MAMACATQDHALLMMVGRVARRTRRDVSGTVTSAARGRQSQSQSRAIRLIRRRLASRTDVVGTKKMASASQKKTRCGAAFNEDETDCAGVDADDCVDDEMYGTVLRKIGRKEK
mmetsp:Transcript_12924/g.14337  ORF Transcript_12924/g.14337 Transcript_12924/m.14337 type:complete len:114 (+) Transcript_12924:434-775(+)